MIQTLKSALFCLLLALPLVACDKEETSVFVETTGRYVADNLPEYDALVAANSGKWQNYCDAADALAYKHKRDNGGITLVGSSTFTFWYDFKNYMKGMPVRNMGIGGATVFDLMCNGEKLIYPYKPSVVVIYIGDNDMLKYGNELFESTFDLFLRNLKYRLPDVKVLLMSVKPSPARIGCVSSFLKVNSFYQQCAESYDYVSYISFWDDFYGRSDLFKEDGLHMNDKGRKIFASKLVPAIEALYYGKWGRD